MKQPQEIMVWYILPVIRSRLANFLKKDHNHSQKEIADLLGLTEAAVSQYLSGKRAKDVKLGSKVDDEIKKSAMIITTKPGEVRAEIQRICKLVQNEKILCKVHRKFEPELGKCGVCFK